MDCLFCKIVAKDIPAAWVYEGRSLIAFKDISPQAPVHLLLVPKKHITTVNDFSGDDTAFFEELFSTVQKLAKEFDVAEKGYRLVMNCNQEGGQSVYHVHAHLLGGRQLGGSMVG